MRFDTVVRDGHVVTPAGVEAATIAISDGTIAGILAPDAEAAGDRVIDAEGKYVLPGGVDPHVHMMDPGDTHREDFETGTAAAAAGGVTTVGEHHRTDPMVLTAEILASKREHLSPKAHVDFGLLAGGHPGNVDEMSNLVAAGALAIKSFTCEVHGVPALQSADMLELFSAVEAADGISMIHPEDELILNANEARVRAAGLTDGRAIPAWRSPEAEAVAVATTLEVAARTGVSMWFAHVSHPALLDQINDARDRGAKVFAETCPQYLYLTADDVIEDSPYTMFTPPPRNAADRDGLWNRLANGEIDMVNADHAPATREEKAEGEENVFEAPFGIPGVETVLPLLLNGVAEGRVTIERVAEVFATNPAKITGLYPRKGAIRVGSDADLVVANLGRERTLRDDSVVAKCGWTPYDGLTVTGVPETTLVRGEPVWSDGELVGPSGHGEFVAPEDGSGHDSSGARPVRP